VTGGLLAAPLAADAQQAGKVYRVGFLWDSPAVWPHALEPVEGSVAGSQLNGTTT
jgi:hypothetical protein